MRREWYDLEVEQDSTVVEENAEMLKNYTYVLLELRYYFRGNEAVEGWRYTDYGIDEEYWVFDEGSSPVTKTAKEIYEAYGADFVVEETIPVRVGSKASLLEYLKESACRYPEGTRIVQVRVEKEEPSYKLTFEPSSAEDYYLLEEEKPFYDLTIKPFCGEGYYWVIKEKGEVYQSSDPFDSKVEAKVDGERQLKWLQENS